MKIKLVVAILAIALITPTPSKSQQQPPEQKWLVPAICAAIGLVVVGTMIYHIWKWCKRIPTTPPPDDPPEPGDPTNAPPKASFVLADSNPPVIIETIPGEAIGCWNVSGYTNQHGYDVLMGTTVESSTDLKNWVPMFHFLGWTTSAPDDHKLLISVFDPGWTKLTTRVGYFTNEISFSDLPMQLPSQQQFYRLRKPERFRP